MIISDAVSDLAKTTLYSERDYEVALALAQAIQAALHLPALGDRQLLSLARAAATLATTMGDANLTRAIMSIVMAAASFSVPSRWAGAGPPPEPDPAWTVSR